MWYRRTFQYRALKPNERLILHFEAVDYSAIVWINGKKVVSHQSGYTPFSADITTVLSKDGPQEIVVRAEDDPADLAKPRGKQDWKLEPHSIWYYRTSGIWQTVWLEVVPETRLQSIHWTSSLERWEIGLEAQIHGPATHNVKLCVDLQVEGQIIAKGTYTVIAGEVHRTNQYDSAVQCAGSSRWVCRGPLPR
jgi:beta-galactosidase/beta-glucuronidase